MAAVVLLAGVGAWFVAKGLSAFWKDLNHPHANVFHQNPIDGSREALIVDQESSVNLTAKDVVKPLFGPAGIGAFQKFDMSAAIWAVVPDFEYVAESETAASAPSSAANNLYSLDDLMLSEADKNVKAKYTQDLDKFRWQLVFSDIVLRDVGIDTRLTSATAHVTIPREVLDQTLFHGATPPTLMAQFSMLPPATAISSSQLLLNNVTTLRRPHRFGLKALWPPLPRNLSDGDRQETNHKVANDVQLFSSVLQHMIVLPRPSTKSNGTTVPVFQPYLTTRTRASYVPDFHTYRKVLYLKRQSWRQAWRERQCPDWSRSMNCKRTFKEDGPFETFIESKNMSEGQNQEAFLFGPYMTTRAQFPGPSDFIRLANSSESLKDDLSFDWHIIWAADKTAKFDFVNDMSANALDTAPPFNMTSDEMKGAQGAVDFNRSLFGTHPEHDSKHAKYTFSMLLAGFFGFLCHPLILHYWYTRRVATGISLGTCVADHVWGFLAGTYSLLKLVRKSGVGIDFGLSVPSLLYRAATLWPIILLYMRIEWQWGGPGGVWPVVVGRRQWTHRERASQRTDQMFDWRIKVAIGVAYAGWSLFGPTLPTLLELGPSFIGEREEEKSHRTIESTLHVLGAAFSFVNIVSQSIVNHRQRTFAGDHRLTIYLLFASLFAWAIPILLSFKDEAWRKVGDPVPLEVVGQWLTLIVVVSQAMTLPSVPQVEDSED
ncbi:hypothetical protein OIV83_002730 [Microbotryomycetes sp. JL201]|nr:hypothetical protein OIV83_002730 [Microbotryomycetes sp. JL201]